MPTSKNLLPCKIVFFGDTNSGKTQLVKAIEAILKQEKIVFETEHKATVGREIFCINIENAKLYLYDTPGNEQYQTPSPSSYEEAHIGVYCISLSEEIKPEKIESEINKFREIAKQHFKLIVVGTKYDLHTTQDSQKITLLAGAVKDVELRLTSVKTEFQTSQLVARLLTLSQKKIKPSNNQTPISTAYEILLLKLKALPPNKKSAIESELTVLLSRLKHSDANSAIEKFTEQCSVILERKHRGAMDTVLILAAVAVVATLLVILIGFGIEFMAEAWTESSAFITALLATVSAAITFVALAKFERSALANLSLFKTSSEMIAVNEFTAEIRSQLNLGSNQN